eukprot:CAMPEP_0170409938 /NCGR_PEP_ID=MMETSP0117_2-20130122/29612_1 /TAXON_ID=400756 /ORGANISM="Durinskia baltica, Strain CSIRO CS-38" /LENGTH=225 /DNA_ID=CAMNT_0010667415 /DNA_START=78 /DNA_END=752 /DNA_ORIENTATION=-
MSPLAAQRLERRRHKNMRSTPNHMPGASVRCSPAKSPGFAGDKRLAAARHNAPATVTEGGSPAKSATQRGGAWCRPPGRPHEFDMGGSPVPEDNFGPENVHVRRFPVVLPVPPIHAHSESRRRTAPERPPWEAWLPAASTAASPGGTVVSMAAAKHAARRSGHIVASGRCTPPVEAPSVRAGHQCGVWNGEAGSQRVPMMSLTPAPAAAAPGDSTASGDNRACGD